MRRQRNIYDLPNSPTFTGEARQGLQAFVTASYPGSPTGFLAHCTGTTNKTKACCGSGLPLEQQAEAECSLSAFNYLIKSARTLRNLSIFNHFFLRHHENRVQKSTHARNRLFTTYELLSRQTSFFRPPFLLTSYNLPLLVSSRKAVSQVRTVDHVRLNHSV